MVLQSNGYGATEQRLGCYREMVLALKISIYSLFVAVEQLNPLSELSTAEPLLFRSVRACVHACVRACVRERTEHP
jgi:hypothetical protein